MSTPRVRAWVFALARATRTAGAARTWIVALALLSAPVVAAAQGGPEAASEGAPAAPTAQAPAARGPGAQAPAAQDPAAKSSPAQGPAVRTPRAAGGVVSGEAAVVRVWHREITELRAGLGRLSAAHRAQQAVDRTLALPETSLGAPVAVEQLTIGNLDAYNFSVDDRFLFSLFELDLDPGAHETLAEHAETVRERLAEVLEARLRQRSLPMVLRAVGFSVAATLVMALLLWGITRAKQGGIKLVRRRAARSERLRVRDLDLRPYVADVLERLIGGANLIAIGATLYVWLGYCLEQFPYTQPWGDKLTVFLTDLLHRAFLALVGFFPDLVMLVLIAFVTRGAARTLSAIFQRLERRAERAEGVVPESLRATRRISVVVVWIFGVVFAYPHLPGAQSEAFKGVTVLLGLMISLGSSGLVNQIMSGFVVLYSRAVRRGEVVRIGEVEGQVTELGFLSTKVLLPSGEQVSLPNALVVTHSTTNFSRAAGEGRAVASTEITIGYDVPWRQVRALLLLAAQRTEGVTRDPAPRVGQRALGDHYAAYALYFQVDDGKQRPAVLSRLHAAIQDAFNEFGVQIMSPHFVAQPEQPVVVPRGQEEPEPAPRFRFARESAPASFDPVEQAAEERAEKEAREAEKAERIRLREEHDAAEAEAKAKAKAEGAPEPESEPDPELASLEAELAEDDADPGDADTAPDDEPADPADGDDTPRR